MIVGVIHFIVSRACGVEQGM